MKKQFTSKFLMALAAVGCSAGLSAQTVIKVGASQEAYQKTIQMAYDSIMPDTIKGSYVIEIQSDYDPSAELYPISLKGKPGASAANAITIKPATGVKKVIANPVATKMITAVGFEKGVFDIVLPDVSGVAVDDNVYGIGIPAYATNTTYVKVVSINESTKTVTLSVATASLQTSTTLFFGKIQTSTLQLNGAKYVTIDGVSRTGDTGLTIQNPNNIYAKTILLITGAQNNTVKNCFIKGTNLSGEFNNGTCGTIYFGTGENDFNSFEMNDICDIDGLPMPISSVLFGGNSNDNTFSQNNIYNISTGLAVNGNGGFFQFPSYMGTSKNYVLNNRMYWTKPASFNAGVTLIGMGGSMNGLGNRIEGNVIGYGAADGTGVSELTSIEGVTGVGIVGFGIKNTTFINNTMGGINATVKNITCATLGNHNTSTPNADELCNGNIFQDITVNATASGATIYGLIYSIANPVNANIKNNIVKDLVIASPTPANKCSALGMSVTGTAHATARVSYSNNKVMNLTSGDDLSAAANEAYGINIGANTAVFERNYISNLRAISTLVTGFIRGYQISGSNAEGLLFKNNIARLGTDVMNDLLIYGIYQGAATSVDHAMKIYNNTIYVGGIAPITATKNTFGFFHTGLAAKNDLKNNIIANKRTVGNTEAHYAMQVTTSMELTSADYNIYQFGKYFGNVEAANADNLAVWAETLSTATSIFDAHSVVADPMFVAPDAAMANMNIQQASPAKGTGVVLADVTTDFNGFARSTSDIGALAFGSFNAVNTVVENALSVYATNNAIVINNQMGQTARIYSLSGQMVKASLLQSDNESISMNKGFYVVRVNGSVSKVLVK